jgi:hypothetical protein
MFNEKKEEYSVKQGKNVPVWASPKYEEAKKKAIELIESKKYDLTEGDFWILMNETKTGKMGYSGLIISHNGCLKINDKLENKFNTKCVELDKDGYANSLVYTYTDEDVFEIGEVSIKNCKNDYPYAMAFKRCFDRVVLKKSKLAYAGVYSDSEADEFSGKDIETSKMPTQEEIDKAMVTDKEVDVILKLLNGGTPQATNKNISVFIKKYNKEKLEDLLMTEYVDMFHIIQKYKEKNKKEVGGIL